MRNLRNKIIFLGTGGGGSMVSLQTCATAGFWVNLEGVDLYFDPGPSAIYKIREAKLVPDNLKAILVTHCHLDHCSDLNALIEAVHYQITKGGWNFKDYQLFVPSEVIKEGYIIKDHLKMPGKVIKVLGQKKYRLKHLTIQTTKKLLEKPYYQERHEEYGYQLKGKKLSLAYLPESFYQPDLYKKITADLIILNAMKPTGEYYEQSVKTIKEISPKLVLLQHWVRRAYLYGPEKLAKKLAKETGVKVLAMRDGDVFDLNKRRVIRR